MSVTSAAPGGTAHGRIHLAIGGLAGAMGGLLGVGGGFLMVPLQVLWARTPHRRASGSSLAAIVPIAIVAAAVYYFGSRSPQLDLTAALVVMIGSSAGAITGSLLARRTPEHALKLVLVAVLLVGAFKELHDAVLGAGQAAQGGAPTAFSAAGYIELALTGAVIGAVSGLTGVGGGILMVPALVLLFGLGQRVAQGTSLLAILPTAAFGAIVHRRHGDLDDGAAGRMAAAGVPASLVGSAVALLLPQRVLAGLFGVLLVVMAYRMWPRGSEAETAD